MAKPIITVENLSKKYALGEKQSFYTLRDSISGFFVGKKNKEEEFWALKDINFEIKQGESVGIIGRNGAGKSTLLKILSQITPPTTGKITMRGRVASLLEVGTGFHQELTGRENIFLNGAILGMSREEVKKKFDEIVAFSEIEKFLDMPVKHYSSGMYMRLAFAVAAHLESEILIVDEVLAVGDAQFQKKCLGKMDEVAKKEGRTVLFVSHNMGAIKSLCSRSMIIEKGKIELIGESEKVVRQYINESNNYSKNNSIHYDKLVYIENVEILSSEGYQKSSFLTTEDVHVKVNFVVKEALKLGNYCGLIILDEFQNILIMAYDIDSNSKYYKFRPPGKYEVTFTIGKNILNEQVVNLNVVCGIPLKYNNSPYKNLYFDSWTGISFRLYNTNSFSRDYFGGQRSGVMLLKINSQVKCRKIE